MKRECKRSRSRRQCMPQWSDRADSCIATSLRLAHNGKLHSCHLLLLLHHHLLQRHRAVSTSQCLPKSPRAMRARQLPVLRPIRRAASVSRSTELSSICRGASSCCRGQRWHIESHLSRRSTISPSYRRLAAAVPLSFTLPAGCREVPRPIRRPMVSAPRTWQGRRTLRVDDTE